jgi:hypothetical protein
MCWDPSIDLRFLHQPLGVLMQDRSSSTSRTSCPAIDGRLSIDEPEQHQGAQEQGAGDNEHRVKRRRARKIRPAHGG